MSDGNGWRSLLDSLLDWEAPPGTRLRAALFTTYDRPDERLLVESLLPQLLGLSREVHGETAERERFFVELVRRLKALRPLPLGVIASMPKPADGEERSYPWLWRCIDRFHVGRDAAAIQHAKLWLLHWSNQENQEQVQSE